MAEPQGKAPVARDAAMDCGPGVLPADTLHMLPELIAALGGDAARFYREAGVDAAAAGLPSRAVPAHAAARLLDLAQRRLDCPDLGLRLAEAQRSDTRRNLFELVMRHSPSLLDAFTWCADHCRTYSGSVGVVLEARPRRGRGFVRVEFDATRSGEDRQILELMVLRMFHVAGGILGDRPRTGEVWFEHEPAGSSADYARHFGCLVRFGRPVSGFFLDRTDLEASNPQADPQILELATYFIEHRFPAPVRPLRDRVGSAVARLLQAGAPCGSQDVSARLGLHYRTIRRRLRDEGTSFEAIRDEVRRELTLRCLAQSDLSLTRLAEMLGYAEVSALSRSCQRWFDRSPRCLRKELVAGALQPA